MKQKQRNGRKPVQSIDRTRQLFVGEGDHVVLGTGLVALDIVVGPHADSVPRYWAGGTCGNVLMILAYLGWSAYPAAGLGNDVASSLITKDMLRFGVRIRFLNSAAGRGTPVIVEKLRIGPDGVPRHRFTWACPVCGAWLPGYRTLAAAHTKAIIEEMPSPKLFFFDRVSRSSIALAKASAERGALVVFEPNGAKNGRLFQEALQISHVIKYSQERVGPLRSIDKCEGRKLQVETLGDEGLRYRLLNSDGKGNQWTELSPYPIAELRDSAGAGDWCTAGIVHVLARGGFRGFNEAKPSVVEDAMQFGQALAAIKCGYEGPRGIMYSVTKDELKENLEKVLKRLPVSSVASTLQPTDVPVAFKGLCPSCPEHGRIVEGPKVESRQRT